MQTQKEMAALLNSAGKIPLIARGSSRLIRSLTAERPSITQLENEPLWRTEFVELVGARERTSLADIGYWENEIHRCNGKPDDAAIIGPFQVLTVQGAECVAAVCRELETFAPRNDFIVTKRLRSVEQYSKFIYNMLRDRRFLLTMSRLVGVPLIPHPLSDAAVQINYYSTPDDGDPPEGKVAKWHLDGMDYVFTVLLTDHAEFDGGEFVYFHGHKDEFEVNRPDCVHRFRKAPFRQVGDVLFTRGSRLFHAVTSVSRGRRITLVISLFCPYLARHDSNRFWHSAPDDGLPRTVANWLKFKIPVRKPAYYCRLVDAPVITWEDLEE